MDWSRAKVMANIFWDAQGSLLVDFLEDQRIITSACYESVVTKFIKALAEKPLGKLQHTVFYYHDNVLVPSSSNKGNFGSFEEKSLSFHFMVLIWLLLTSFCFLFLKSL